MAKPGYKRLPTRHQYGIILPEQAVWGIDEDVVGQEQAVLGSITGCSWSGACCMGSEVSVVGQEQSVGVRSEL